MANVIHRTDRDGAGALLYRTSVNTPEYDTNDWLVNPDLSSLQGIVAAKYWKVTGVAPGGVVEEMTQGEKDAVDAAELAAAKLARKTAIKTEAWSYLESRYDAGEQRIIIDLQTETYINSKPNRRAALSPYFVWREQVMQHMKTQFQSINSQTTVEDVNAVVIDTAAMDLLDPGINLITILGIAD